MTHKKVYLAIDLGAGSGRVLAGEFDGRRIDLVEIHRFENTPVELPSGSHWNITALYQSILDGLRKAAVEYGDRIASIGVDTWGVDYALFDRSGRMLGLPYQYRDSRNDGMMEKVFAKVPDKEVYDATGIQFMPFNTIFQLTSEIESGSPALAIAEDLLFMPQIITYWLTGKMVQERSFASTTQLYNPKTHNWDYDLISRLGLPKKLFKEIVDPGTPLGTITKTVQDNTGLGPVEVITVAGHDTANAVAAVPSHDSIPAYLSSGTWSLMGLELPEPVINEQSFADAFTNEIGVNKTVRFLKNICGLWLIQESRRYWLADGIDIPYSKLASLASEVTPFQAFINPDDPLFANAGKMPEKIQQFCRDTGQFVPDRKRQIIRIVYESLALRYAQIWESLVNYTQQRPLCLHIVGGGCQDKLLNQMAANAIGVPVLAGPVEATGLGNITTQAIAQGDIANLHDSRKIIIDSATMERFEPQDQERWNAQKERFAQLTR